MSYDCSDLVQDITLDAARLKLLTEAEHAALDNADDPRATTDAVCRIFDTTAKLRRQLVGAYMELARQGLDTKHPRMKSIRKLLHRTKGKV